MIDIDEYLNASDIKITHIHKETLEKFGFIYSDGNWALITQISANPVTFAILFIDEKDMSVTGGTLNANLTPQRDSDLTIAGRKNIWDGISNLKQRLYMYGISDS